MSVKYSLSMRIKYSLTSLFLSLPLLCTSIYYASLQVKSGSDLFNYRFMYEMASGNSTLQDFYHNANIWGNLADAGTAFTYFVFSTAFSFDDYLIITNGLFIFLLNLIIFWRGFNPSSLIIYGMANTSLYVVSVLTNLEKVKLGLVCLLFVCVLIKSFAWAKNNLLLAFPAFFHLSLLLPSLILASLNFTHDLKSPTRHLSVSSYTPFNLLQFIRKYPLRILLFAVLFSALLIPVLISRIRVYMPNAGFAFSVIDLLQSIYFIVFFSLLASHKNFQSFRLRPFMKEFVWCLILVFPLVLLVGSFRINILLFFAALILASFSARSLSRYLFIIQFFPLYLRSAYLLVRYIENSHLFGFGYFDL